MLKEYLKFKNIVSNIINNHKNLRKSNKLPKSYKKNLGNSEEINHILNHKNNICLFFLNEKKIFRKYSDDKNGIKKIISEYHGLRWYCKQSGLNQKKVIKYFYNNKKYAVLDINFIKGRKIKSWRPLSENYNYLIRIFNHYKKIFKKKNLHKIHGDLTLDNVFFGDKRIFILDWEFYGANKYLWGYDLVYLALSSICIPFIASGIFSKKDEKLFVKLWKILKKMGMSRSLIYNPFAYFENVFKNDKILNANSKISKSKFFPLITTKKFKIRILKIINSQIH